MFFKSPRPISISLLPNTQRDDVLLALKLIFQPWLWKRGKAVAEIEEEFKKYLGVKYAISFNSGRSAFLSILKSLDSGPSLRWDSKSKVLLLQAFTCNAVPNPVLWAGFKPVYVDCQEDNFNIDFSQIKKKITQNTKVLIVQHTFGLPVNMDEILKICQENNLILIEDCAHSLGAAWKGQKVGTLGKAAFFSFSRDKVISSVYGGMAITNDDVLAEKIRQFQRKAGYPSSLWILQQLLHPVILNFIILPLYKFLDLGKICLIFFQWTNILSKAVHWKEKRGEKPNYFPKALPNALAILALNQFKKLDKFYQHRRKIAEFYYNELKNSAFEVSQYLSPKFLDSQNIKHSFLRFTIKHKRAHEIIRQCWDKENILIGDWYTSPIAPEDTQLEKIGYKTGDCPVAEKLSKETLNLPTHINISEKDSQRIINFLSKWR